MNNNTRQNYRGNRFRGNLEGMVDRIVEKVTGMKGMVIIIQTGIGQGKESLQEVMVEIEALTMIDLDQGPELVQIGIG